MRKIKLKPHLESLEVAMGNLVDLKLKQGEVVEVSEEIFGALINLGHFEEAGENLPESLNTLPGESAEKPADDLSIDTYAD